MKIAVVTFPGSNCDDDAAHVARDIVGAEVVSAWHKDVSLPPGVDLAILPGGFSYGDALRSGALARFSPIMQAVAAHARRGGLVLGICNGFQILVEAGLLPGAMLPNASTHFVCRQVNLRVANPATPFTSLYRTGACLRMPVAHHEGRYVADDDTLQALFDRGQVALTYEPSDNPNGSSRDIAGIVNATMNVFGLMPHPERACEAVLGTTDGKGIFDSIASYLASARPS